MLRRVKTAALSGVQGRQVVVEAAAGRGLPGLHIVGLADTTVKEAGQRIRPAIINSGFSFPGQKVTVNLVPADMPKEGSHFDLPIAIGIMMLEEDTDIPQDTAFIGEMSLDGNINGVKGALPLAVCMRKMGIKNIVLPADNFAEVSLIDDVSIVPVQNLQDTVLYMHSIISGEELRKRAREKIQKRRSSAENEKKEAVDFKQVVGQESVKRAMVIGAAGNHGMLLMGSPGCGKTMMARRLPTILPEMSIDEKLEVTAIHSIAGVLDRDSPVVEERPFRSPFQTVTVAALTGGGARPRPGELSLAHRGVLFLDEIGEFENRVIDSLRQPVEEGFVRVNRSAGEVVFPSQVMILISANPCKCGNLWSDKKVCTCSARQLKSYRSKLTGPFADRIDMYIRVNKVDRESLAEMKGDDRWESSESMRAKVEKAREIQKLRYKSEGNICNGNLDDRGIRKYCGLTCKGRAILNKAYDKMELSMRGYNKIIKVARTIADLEGKASITETHIAEALMYRVDFYE